MNTLNIYQKNHTTVYFSGNIKGRNCGYVVYAEPGELSYYDRKHCTIYMRKLEAHFQTIFKHWVQSQWRDGSAAFELKRTETDKFYVSHLAPHQKLALTAAYEDRIYHKISDGTFSQNPFDCFVLQQSLAYVVIAFGKRLSGFYLIPIYTWNEKTKEKSSVTEGEVKRWEEIQYIKIPTARSL